MRIFISYRRSETSHIVGRIYDHLIEREKFERAHIHRDVDTFELGDDFGPRIEKTMIGVEVALIIIGPNWAMARDEKTGELRLQNPEDWVRREVEMALGHVRKVIPVLVAGAKMPQKEDLPSSLHPLLNKHAATLHDDPHFRSDLENLVSSIRRSWNSDNPLTEKRLSEDPTPIPSLIPPMDSGKAKPNPKASENKLAITLALLTLVSTVLVTLIGIIPPLINESRQNTAFNATATSAALTQLTNRPTNTSTSTLTETITIAPTFTPTVSSTGTMTSTHTLTPSVTETTTISPTFTPTASSTYTPTSTDKNTPTNTLTPSVTPDLTIKCQQADIDRNGLVDAVDYDTVRQVRSSKAGESGYSLDFDLNRNGEIDGEDLRGVLNMNGYSCLVLPPPTECQKGDVTKDGKILADDYNQVMALLGKVAGSETYDEAYDMDRNGVINGNDGKFVLDSLNMVCNP